MKNFLCKYDKILVLEIDPSAKLLFKLNFKNLYNKLCWETKNHFKPSKVGPTRLKDFFSILASNYDGYDFYVLQFF